MRSSSRSRRLVVPRHRLRIGLALRRRPPLRRAIVAAAAALVGLFVMSTVQRAEAAREAWGATRPVVVATRALRPGHELRPGDVQLADHPRALVPDDAVRGDPVGRIVHSPVYEGEVLLDARLAEAGRTGIAARLPPGHRAVALPREPGATPDVETGQRVDVIVVLSVDEAGADPPGLVVAADALVIDVSDEAVTVAVLPEDATRVAVALAAGVVTITVAGG